MSSAISLVNARSSPQALAMLRIWVFGLWLLKTLTDPFELLGHLPAPFFDPPGVVGLIPDSMLAMLIQPSFLLLIRLATVVVLVMVILGLFTNAAAVIAALLLTFSEGLLRSFHYINHSEFSLLYAVYILALFPIGDAFTLRKTQPPERRPEMYGAPIVAILAMICLTYVLISLHRLTNGGPELFLSADTLKTWFLNRSYKNPGLPWLQVTPFVVRQPILWAFFQLGFPIVTALEALAPLNLISRRFRLVFLPVIGIFHLLTIFFMKILFWENIALYVVFFDLDAWLKPRAAEGRRPIVFFDGVCGLCNRFVSFVMRQDSRGIFLFAPLQGEAARKHLGEPTTDPAEWSIILVDEDGVHYRSEAALRIVTRLGWFWRGASLLRWIPRPLRDGAYGIVARRRYAWFGQRQACRVPTLAERARFLA